MLTTLCYIEKEDEYLMLHRTKKINDMNHDKWLGIGGKIEKGESPEECIVRECKEETGLTLTNYRLRGIITFVADENETEYMFLYTAKGYTGDIIECSEGNLEWVKKTKINELNLWEGDKVFFELLAADYPVFSLKLVYSGEKLVKTILDGKELD